MDLNRKAIEVKETIKEVTKHFNYSEYQINLLTIVYLAIYKLEPDIEDLILKTLKDVYIFLTDLDLVSAYKLINPNADAHDIRYLEECSGAIYFSRDILSEKMRGIPFILITKKLVLEDLFDAIFHELKHALNDVLMSLHQAGDLSYYFSGLRKIKLYTSSYEVIDEAFNSFIVYLYLLKIMELKCIEFSDKEINMILNQFHIGENYRYAYHDYVKLLERLFKSKYLFWLFENASLFKDFEPLFEALTKVFNNNISGEQFFWLLDFCDPELLNGDLKIAFDNINYSFIKEEQIFSSR